jgi:hypothetical protein
MRKMKKLTLGRETLRALDPNAVAQAAGGTGLTFSCACSGTPWFSAGCPHAGTNNSCERGTCHEN